MTIIKQKQGPDLMEETFDFSSETVEPSRAVSGIISSTRHRAIRVPDAFLGLSTSEIWKQKDAGNIEAYKYLVEVNMGFGYSLLSRRYRMFFKNRVVREDLEQEALLGIMEAVKRFDFSREVKFTVFAEFWIKKYVFEYLVKNSHLIKLPKRLQQDVFVLQKISRCYLVLNQSIPSSDVLSRESGFSIKKVDRLKSHIGYLTGGDISIDAKMSESDENEGVSLLDKISSEEKGFFELENLDQRTTFMRLFKEKFDLYYRSKDKERDYDIFVNWFGFTDDMESLVLEKLGEKYDISRQRIFQIIDKCERFVCRFTELMECLLGEKV